MVQDVTGAGHAADDAKVTIHQPPSWRYLPGVRLEFEL
jgi:hypothetical protein